jgi:RNA polymerase sigma factor (sigma-70 family)
MSTPEDAEAFPLRERNAPNAGGVGRIENDRVEGRPLEEAELVEAARGGDVDAYAGLVERHRDVAFRTAYFVTRSTADAEDAAQEAFVKAYYALGRFRAGEPFRPWLLRIVGNEARNRIRAAQRRERMALRLAHDRPSDDAAPSPESAAIRRDALETLASALAALPERDRLVVSYRYLLELSEAETAAVLGIRPGTVKSRLSRALARLRRSMPELGDVNAKDLEVAGG